MIMRLAEIEDLATSIAHQGLLQPVTVYRHGPSYRLVSGERRYWACQLAGLVTIKAIPLARRPENLRELQYAENVHRAELSVLQQAERCLLRLNDGVVSIRPVCGFRGQLLYDFKQRQSAEHRKR